MSCPNLVILGNPVHGGVVAHDDRPRLQRFLKDMTLLEWDDVGHGIHTEQPERFISEVQKYLSYVSNLG